MHLHRGMPVEWDPERYLAFAEPRLRPPIDLLARVPLRTAQTVVDLGCGPGNLIPHLQARFPEAAIIGVDASREMLARARAAHPEITFVETDLAGWRPDAPVGAYYRWLAPHAAALDIWQTDYLHVLEGDDPVLAWARSSTLLPALALLQADEVAPFLSRYRDALRRAYPPEADGRTLFPFRRLFVVATARG